ncbi:hypothetical protein EUTSA_v10003049mg [Eutrema salsugineum]|uniref:Ubiquitin-like protease family profile domain-containing protein n=1 Tax=Eutrema salsugineum TaxID=72664 RepID=V4MXK0_EUTSA|nr:hypothetical protein EUTSA_v10003049mg [Eutrema salsugineum]
MDGIMYLFREYTSLGRFQHAHVGFMSCNFSLSVGAAYKQLLANKKIPVGQEKKQLVIKPYTVQYVLMRPGINRSACDCGVYALKFIEAHMLGLHLSLINDDNIYSARLKITYDLWKAAHDPILIERMRKYVPPKTVCSEDIKDLR